MNYIKIKLILLLITFSIICKADTTDIWSIYLNNHLIANFNIFSKKKEIQLDYSTLNILDTITIYYGNDHPSSDCENYFGIKNKEGVKIYSQRRLCNDFRPIKISGDIFLNDTNINDYEVFMYTSYFSKNHNSYIDLFTINQKILPEKFNLNSKTFAVGGIYTPINNIVFDFEKYDIKTENVELLDSFYRFLKTHDSLYIEIGVHFDNRYLDKYSNSLDYKRAKRLKEYLISKGIEDKRIIPKGYGKTNLLISDEEIHNMKTTGEKESAYAKNRRIEFKIIAIH